MTSKLLHNINHMIINMTQDILGEIIPTLTLDLFKTHINRIQFELVGAAALVFYKNVKTDELCNDTNKILPVKQGVSAPTLKAIVDIKIDGNIKECNHNYI